MHYNQHKSNVEVRLNGILMPKCKMFIYLCSIFQENGMIDEDATQKNQNKMVEMKSEGVEKERGRHKTT